MITPNEILCGNDSCVHTAFPESFVATALQLEDSPPRPA